MFNWFKNQHTLIPNDINNGLMTTKLCGGLKLGSKIVIPSDIVCFVSYKDKIYQSLETGSYTLDEKLLQELYTKQAKDNKTKRLKIDLFFINKKKFSIDTAFKDKIPVSHKMTKFDIRINTQISVHNALTFTNYILNDVATITAEESIDLFRDYIEIFSKNFLVKIELTENDFSEDIRSNFQEKLAKYLTKIGVTLHSLTIDLDTKDKVEKKASFFNHLDTLPTKDDKTIKETEQKPVDDTTKTEYTNEDKYCPNCNMKLIQGSAYCHRCGYEIKNNNQLKVN